MFQYELEPVGTLRKKTDKNSYGTGIYRQVRVRVLYAIKMSRTGFRENKMMETIDDTLPMAGRPKQAAQ